jgi:hypothetical protein
VIAVRLQNFNDRFFVVFFLGGGWLVFFPLFWGLVIAVRLQNFKAQLSRTTSTFLAVDSFIRFLIFTVNMLLAPFKERKI